MVQGMGQDPRWYFSYCSVDTMTSGWSNV